ncbi:MAG: AAA family ATPase [Candidatus Cloacimonetes bacterium]|nr:AAA family ATPase [Candidatus Cloacimonadota bacterium]
MKKIPIGYSDFKRIRSAPDFLYVDKTGLIEEFLEDPAQILLITRPRRFGKTLNLSTLRYFFDHENAEENRKLFEALKISQNAQAMQEQGTRPVIYLTFKDCKELNWEHLQKKISYLLAETVIPYTRAGNFLLEPADQEILKNLRAGTQDITMMAESLKFLSRIVSSHYGQNPLILIDEYDVPLQSAWTSGYWDEAISFFRNFFSAGFKDNPYLWRGVITGCLRVARESMFTGMNNLAVSSVSSKKYSTHFGFTVPEVKQLIQDYNLVSIEEKIESWYNGYCFGETTIYNPWSILNLLHNQGTFRNYWMNTSGNDLVKEILGRSGVDTKKDLEDLMAGRSITVALQEQVVFQEIENSPANIWNFLYFTGYLKSSAIHQTDEAILVDLKIPNVEIKRVFFESIQYWFQSDKTSSILKNLKQSLQEGVVTEVTKTLRKLCETSLSYFDASGKDPEKFYHGLVLGLIVSFSDIWNIRSNRESGLGRCDLLMTPKNPAHFGIVMEFKTMDSYEDSDLLACAQNAMDQIESRQYEQELRSQGATKILKMGIGFSGKVIEILSNRSDG